MKSIFKKTLPLLAPLLGWLIAQYIKFVLYSGRWEFQIPDATQDYLKSEKAFVAIFWHSRLFMMPVAKQRSLKMKIIVSKNFIGDLAEKICAPFNIGLIRGSSLNPKKPHTYKNSANALKHIVQFLQQGGRVAFTPDGPKGPAMVMKAGAVIAAKMANAPIICASYSCAKGKNFNSWDHFLMPYPFSKGIIIYSEPIDISEEDDTDICCKMLEKKLIDITNEADKKMGRECAPVRIL
ncbi:MAG: lysophospholipid acyltransferase family protein [Pseudomonadota bacterium]